MVKTRTEKENEKGRAEGERGVTRF